MKRLFSLLLLCSLLFSSRCFAQVNPQNGAAQINIPLYSYKDAGNRLGLNASLDYKDGNGLKVSELASAVGTGWELNCGGMISRIQHGEPDDQNNSSFPSYDFTNQYPEYVSDYFPNGYLYNTSTSSTPYLPTDIIDNGGAYSPYEQDLPNGQKNYKLPPQYLADRDQDIFQFSFNGRSGAFFIGKNGQAVTLVDSKLQISFQQTDMSASGIRTRISQFTITDESGIQYVFKDMELSYVCNYTNLQEVIHDNEDLRPVESNDISLLSLEGENNGSAVNVVQGVPNGQFVVNKWYLSAILNPFTGKQITFNYSTYEEDFNTDKTMNSVAANNVLSDVTLFWQRYKVRGKRLSSVNMSDGEQLNFIYSSTPRVDLPLENALVQLQVLYNNSQVYSWNFGYGYMVGIDGTIQSPGYSFSQTEINWSRLCLTTLQRTGLNNISEPPYQFAYNMSGGSGTVTDVVPPMCSVFQDDFGYYNAGAGYVDMEEGFYTSFYSISVLNGFVRNSLGNMKNINGTRAKNGIIQSITNPLGGVLTYAYEGNSTPGGPIGGVRVSSITKYDGSDHNNDIITQYKYVNSDETTSSGWGGETYTYSMSGTSKANGCTSKESPAAVIKDQALSYIQNSFFTQTISIASAEVIGSELCDLAGSIAVAFVLDIILGGQSTPPTITTAYTLYQNQSLVANNPLPWGYGRVEVITQNGPSTAGKTVYGFSNPNGTGDRPIDVPTMSVPYSNKPRYAPWVYGVPESITIYDNNNNLIKQTVNHYTYIVNTLNNSNFQSMSWAAIGAEYGCSYINGDQTSTMIGQETYYPLTGHTQLNSTDEIVYNSAHQSSTLTTTYTYDNNFQISSKSSNDSKGETIQTIYYYPYNYAFATGAIASMNSTSSNILTPILSTETYLTNLAGAKYFIAATATDMGQSADGDFLPTTSYTFQSVFPLSLSDIDPFNQESVVRDPNYYKQVASYGYDNNGNRVQSITGGNRIVSSMYDYDGKFLVATAVNASYSDIGYSSFEAEGGKPGSWYNSAAIVTTDSRTGNASFNLSDPSNATKGYFGFSGLNNSLNYIVSFWSKNGTACLAGSKSGTQVVSTCQGGGGWKQGTVVNGWTYYEVQLNNIDQVSVSGSGLIDEFRIYPVGSQMMTTTYTPLFGKTSECDVANKVTYYQYDELGRLRFVLDDQKNIVRMYDYNYKQ